MSPKEVRLLVSFGVAWFYAFAGYLYGSLVPRQFAEGAFGCFMLVGMIFLFTGKFDEVKQ